MISFSKVYLSSPYKLFNGTTIGYSTGTLNLGNKIFLNPIHGEFVKDNLYGINIYDFYIDVHTNGKSEIHEKLDNDIYLIDDDSAIFCFEKIYEFFGKVIMIKNQNTSYKK